MFVHVQCKREDISAFSKKESCVVQIAKNNISEKLMLKVKCVISVPVP